MEDSDKRHDSQTLEVRPKDVESKLEKIPYPKSVFFIITNEFCERFSFYGMRTVLTLYLTTVLLYSEDDATIIYHGFVMLAYFTPLLGAMLADSYLGKFKTIFYLSIVYAIGNIVLSMAATPPLNFPANEISLLGLTLIAIGTGGIKPCVSAFGGDQFILPQQAEQLVSFFSLFYLSINLGGLLSTVITPIIRTDVQCFGDDHCYSLAFAIPAALMVTSIIVFLAGKFLYREVKPSGNVVVKLCKCIGHAIGNWRGSSESKDHWLDHADDTYDQRFIEDVKIVLRVLVLYIPIPVFWALYDQQGSRWTLQATRMNGVIGGITIQADQVQVLNGLLIIAFIPLFDKIIYPLLAKCGLLKKPTHRLTMGGILAGISFIIAAGVEIQLEKTYPVTLTETQTSLNFVNALPCNITLKLGTDKEFHIAPFGNSVFEAVNAGPYNLYNPTAGGPGIGVGIQLQVAEGCSPIKPFVLSNPINFKAIKSNEELEEQADTDEQKRGGGFTYMITFDLQNNIKLGYGSRSDDREKPQDGKPKLRFLVGGEYFLPRNGSDIPQGKLSVFVKGEGDDAEDIEAVIIKHDPVDGQENVGYSSATISVNPVKHRIFKLVYGRSNENPEVESVVVDFEQEFDFKLGASYVITISKNGSYSSTIDDPLEGFDEPRSYGLALNTITTESSMHIAWLVPQYAVLTAGEIMFSITGLEFSYSQAPVSMKSVMQSAWLMTVAFGNLIVVIIAEAKFFQRQSMEFLLFAILMFADMIIFGILAYFYVPAKLEDPSKKKDDD